ncbi:MAG: hypothetical protein HXS54_12730 [Theionarchaea archaeon]|nr:hypothetical protein [Theionarchaea archaeon]
MSYDIDVTDIDINWNDWNSRLKGVVESLVSLIPEVGQLIDILLSQLDS